MVSVLAGKQRLKGTGKTSKKDYDFIVCHYLGKAIGVEGLSAERVMLDPKQFNFDEILVGHKYNIDHDGNGRLLDFSLVE